MRERYPRRMHVERIQWPRNSRSSLPPRAITVMSCCATRSALSRAGMARCCAAATECCPAEDMLCATCWMHGVFGAQLTIGNTSFHKLFSVSRDPYNITRGSGLRMLVDLGDGWRLLTVPSAFEMGLGDCRWIYRFGERTIIGLGDRFLRRTRHAMARERRRRSLSFPGLRPSCSRRAGVRRVRPMEIDARRKRFVFRPDPDGLWGQRYPNAALPSGDQHARANRSHRRR